MTSPLGTYLEGMGAYLGTVPFTVTLTTSVGSLDVEITDQAVWDAAWAESRRRLELIAPDSPATPLEIDKLAAVIYTDMTQGKTSPIWQQMEPALEEMRDKGWLASLPGLPDLSALGSGLASVGKWAVVGLIALAAILVLRK